MLERNVTVATPDGQMPAFVTCPEARPPKAVVVMIMDGQGWREPMFDNARRLASVGYYVIMPQMFYRRIGQGPVENVLDMDWMTTLNTDITPAKATEDIAACLAFAAADPAAPKGGKAAVMGFCMGGRLSVSVSQGLGDRIACAAALHPGYLATKQPNSPHLALDRISAELYLGVAEHDPHLSPAAVARFTEALNAAGVKYSLEVLPGSGHGYSTPGNDAYHKPSAERAWERIFELFERRLDPVGGQVAAA